MWLASAGVLLAVISLGAWAATPYVRSLAFVLDLAGTTGGIRRVLPVRVHQVTTSDIAVPTRHGTLAARWYAPDGWTGRSVIVFPGIHAGGIDEPRLVTFSTRLAATGVGVLAVPLPDLRVFRITNRSTDMIEDGVRWMAANRALAPRGRVALVGVSFAGGLGLVAAGRPGLDASLDLVLSLGAHGDLPRTMRYLCTGRLPDGTTRPPSDYGVAVILLGAAAEVVPPDQVAPLERGITTFLTASSIEATDAAGAERLVQAARAQAAQLPEPSRTLLTWVVERKTRELGARLLPLVEALGGAAALSPERSPATHAPVFLLHGLGDGVVPASESATIADYLRRAGNPSVDVLLTPLVGHAEVSTHARWIDEWRLIRFWKAVIAAAR
jgi:dienelactone hydrolase